MQVLSMLNLQSLTTSACCALMLIAAMCAGCDALAPRVQEVARVTSPNGQIDLVLVEQLTDATVSTPYELHVVPVGKQPAGEDSVFKVDRSQRPEVFWVDGSTAVVKCDRGRVWRFQNFAFIKSADKGFTSVGISLMCGVKGFK